MKFKDRNHAARIMRKSAGCLKNWEANGFPLTSSVEECFAWVRKYRPDHIHCIEPLEEQLRAGATELVAPPDDACIMVGGSLRGLAKTRAVAKLARERRLGLVAKSPEAAPPPVEGAPPPSSEGTAIERLRAMEKDYHARVVRDPENPSLFKQWAACISELRQGEMKHMDVQERTGKLVPYDTVARVINQRVAGVRQRLLLLPSQICHELEDMDARAVREILEASIHKILKDFAGIDEKADGRSLVAAKEKEPDATPAEDDEGEENDDE